MHVHILTGYGGTGGSWGGALVEQRVGLQNCKNTRCTGITVFLIPDRAPALISACANSIIHEGCRCSTRGIL